MLRDTHTTFSTGIPWQRPFTINRSMGGARISPNWQGATLQLPYHPFTARDSSQRWDKSMRWWRNICILVQTEMTAKMIKKSKYLALRKIRNLYFCRNFFWFNFEITIFCHFPSDEKITPATGQCWTIDVPSSQCG